MDQGAFTDIHYGGHDNAYHTLTRSNDADQTQSARHSEFTRLLSLVEELEGIFNTGSLSKPRSIQTSNPPKQKRRESKIIRGNRVLVPIPLTEAPTQALADFKDDPFVPHAYMVQTA
jgi:hypothetical protein